MELDAAREKQMLKATSKRGRSDGVDNGGVIVCSRCVVINIHEMGICE